MLAVLTSYSYQLSLNYTTQQTANLDDINDTVESGITTEDLQDER